MELIQLNKTDFQVMKSFYLDDDVMKMITGYTLSEAKMQER